ncbi:nitroreductase family protein [Catenovulum sediminis]|uniref:Nitroreductase family protein n=1 Tax=Catenovulum sediminis TaxID=1740262 RepID=A0ABV1RE68_9ALTE
MNIIEALNWRYAVRQFSPEKIAPAVIQKLVEATRLSASAYGLQPYRLLVVRNRETRNQLLKHSFGQEKVRDCSHLFVLAINTEINEAFLDQHFNMVEQQRDLPSGALNGFANHVKDVMLSMTQAELKVWAENQAHIALGNLLTVAAIEGVDACPMAGFDKSGFDAVLQLPRLGLTSAVICTLGQRADTDLSADYPKVRVPSAEFCLDM